MENKRLVILDLDDTLVDTSHVYWVARTRFLALMKELGFPADTVMERFEEIDGNHMSKFGYMPSRYERSMLATYREFTEGMTIPQSKRVLRAIRSAGKIVAHRVPKLIPGSKGLLYWAKRRGYKTILLTRGVHRLQMRKVKTNRLAHYFDGVKVVKSKSKEVFHDTIRAAGFRSEEVWVVGDSIRSDINPGLEAGCDCILYRYTHHAYYWRQEYGETALGPFYMAKKLSEIPKIMAAPGQFTKVITPWT